MQGWHYESLDAKCAAGPSSVVWTIPYKDGLDGVWTAEMCMSAASNFDPCNPCLSKTGSHEVCSIAPPPSLPGRRVDLGSRGVGEVNMTAEQRLLESVRLDQLARANHSTDAGLSYEALAVQPLTSQKRRQHHRQRVASPRGLELLSLSSQSVYNGARRDTTGTPPKQCNAGNTTSKCPVVVASVRCWVVN